MTTRIETVNEFMLKTLSEAGFEDTLDNRIEFLTGLAEVWREEGYDDMDADEAFEKCMFILAVSNEIFHLRMRRPITWAVPSLPSR